MILDVATWELFRVLLFFAAIALTYVRAAKACFVWWENRGGGRVATLSTGDRVSLALAAAGAACMVYGRFVEPFWPEVTRVSVTSPALAGASRPIRVVHLSDLHSDPRARLEERLPGLVAGLEPDAIVFTGDAVNSRDGLPVFKRCMTRLAELAPTFAVKGNWDVRIIPGLDLYGGTGVRELDGDGVLFKAAGKEIWIAGVAVDEEQNLRAALAGAPPGAFTVLLHHYPDWIAEASVRKVGLYAAGHTHGGQVALPFYGALVTLSRYGKRFEAGLYRVRDTWLYVNRGIGMEGASAPRVRFCARPEITLLELSGPAPS